MSKTTVIKISKNTRIGTSTTTATIASHIDTHICNGASDYSLTMPDGAEPNKVLIINEGVGVVTLVGTISGTTALLTLIEGESCQYIYTGGEWK